MNEENLATEKSSTENVESKDTEVTTNDTASTEDVVVDVLQEDPVIEHNKDTEDTTEPSLDWDDKWIKDYAPDICDDGIKRFRDAKFDKSQSKYIVDYINQFKEKDKLLIEKASKKITASFNEKQLSEVQELLKNEYGNNAKDIWDNNKNNFEFIDLLNKYNSVSKPKKLVKSNNESNTLTLDQINQEKKKLMSDPNYSSNDNYDEHIKIMNKLRDLTAKQLSLK
jgi:hypothetical protein